jgi:hypothetical protein
MYAIISCDVVRPDYRADGLWTDIECLVFFKRLIVHVSLTACLINCHTPTDPNKSRMCSTTVHAWIDTNAIKDVVLGLL